MAQIHQTPMFNKLIIAALNFRKASFLVSSVATAIAGVIISSGIARSTSLFDTTISNENLLTEGFLEEFTGSPIKIDYQLWVNQSYGDSNSQSLFISVDVDNAVNDGDITGIFLSFNNEFAAESLAELTLGVVEWNDLNQGGGTQIVNENYVVDFSSDGVSLQRPSFTGEPNSNVCSLNICEFKLATGSMGERDYLDKVIFELKLNQLSQQTIDEILYVPDAIGVRVQSVGVGLLSKVGGFISIEPNDPVTVPEPKTLVSTMIAIGLSSILKQKHKVKRKK